MIAISGSSKGTMEKISVSLFQEALGFFAVLVGFQRKQRVPIHGQSAIQKSARVPRFRCCVCCHSTRLLCFRPQGRDIFTFYGATTHNFFSTWLSQNNTSTWESLTESVQVASCEFTDVISVGMILDTPRLTLSPP